MNRNDYITLAAFRYELRKFLRFSERAAVEHNLAPQQYLALLEIKGFPAREQVTVGELAERLQIAHHSAVGLVNRLEERGLVQRTSGQEDRRFVHVTLTPDGNKVLSKLASVHRTELKKVGPLLVKLLDRASGAAQ